MPVNEPVIEAPLASTGAKRCSTAPVRVSRMITGSAALINSTAAV